MIASIFTDVIVQPIFNLLVLVYALLPGHNFGLSLIIFTIIVRLLLWPLVRKQLHQAKAMRALQPELKRIKQKAKNKQQESTMMMELYKERGINPVGSLPTLLVQFIILFGLYAGLNKVIHDPHQLVNFAYPALQHLFWMQELAQNIHRFDNTLFGVVDLSRAAVGKEGFYFPALLLVAGSALAQYFQSKQLIPTSKDGRSLRAILKEAGEGKQADQAEVNAAVSRMTIYILPVFIFLFTIQIASALSLYWLTGGVVGYLQQRRILGSDEEEMEAIADKPTGKKVKDIPEAQVIDPKPTTQPKPKTKKKKGGKR